MKTTSPKEFKESFLEIIEDCQSILITTHIGPDDDAICSVLSIASFLSRKYPNKVVKLWITGETTGNWDYFNDFSKIEKFDDIYEQDLNQFDAIIFLDGTGFQRFGRDTDRVEGYKGKKICVDHHKTEVALFDLMLADPQASSTAELVYLALFKDDSEMTKEEAEALFLGIYGDTGHFKFVTKDKLSAFASAADLIKRGDISVDLLLGNFETYPASIFEIIREAIKNTAFSTVKGWPKFTFTIISADFIKRSNYRQDEVKMAAALFMAAYIRKIGNSPWGFIIYPKGEKMGASFRARAGSVNVRKIVEDLGVGGGHDQAAGAAFDSLSEQEVLKCIEGYLQENEPVYT